MFPACPVLWWWRVCYSAGDKSLIPGSGISPGEGHGQEYPTPVFLSGESHEQRILAGYSPWGRKESDATEALNNNTAYLFISFIFISWRLILQYCSGFCHTLTWISHGFTCVPHPDPPSHLPPHPIPLGLPSAPAPSTCLNTAYLEIVTFYLRIFSTRK